MSKEYWLEAALAYESAAAAHPARKMLARQEGGDDVAQLDAFLYSEEGYAARRLLAASGQRIVFAETFEGACQTVWYLDGTGLCRTAVRGGGWRLYLAEGIESTDLPPVTIQIPSHIAIEAAFSIHLKNARKKSGEIMTWLRSELDEVAKAAPAEIAA